MKSKNSTLKCIFSVFVSVTIGFIFANLILSLFDMIGQNSDDGKVVFVLGEYVSVAVGAMVTGVLSGFAFGKRRFAFSLECALITIIVMLFINLFVYKNPVDVFMGVKLFVVVFTTVVFAMFIKPKSKAYH